MKSSLKDVSVSDLNCIGNAFISTGLRSSTPTGKYAMDSYENEALSKGYKLVAGIDEAGRGPLAGPVVASAVIFTGSALGIGINDSKKLTPARRTSLVFEIYSRAASVGVGIVWPSEIDKINIHRASLLAMERAVASLAIKPDYLLIDGAFTIKSNIGQRAVKSGDSLSVSIAAASVIAKTARDGIMEAYHRLYPEYGFIRHKGYPTSAHRRALVENGPAPIHRRSFNLSFV